MRLSASTITVPCLLTACILTGCATSHTVVCRTGEQAAVTDTLYFGTNKSGGVVSQNEWTTFVTDTITPAFPQGLTTWTADGQWRMADGTIERETSHIVQLTHEDVPQHDESIRRIIERYRAQFSQEAVLRLRSPVCSRV
ncbi:MAG: DUF3574 domain-containing protein [Nitrospiraceae bacterium]